VLEDWPLVYITLEYWCEALLCVCVDVNMGPGRWGFISLCSVYGNEMKVVPFVGTLCTGGRFLLQFETRAGFLGAFAKIGKREY